MNECLSFIVCCIMKTTRLPEHGWKCWQSSELCQQSALTDWNPDTTYMLRGGRRVHHVLSVQANMVGMARVCAFGTAKWRRKNKTTENAPVSRVDGMHDLGKQMNPRKTTKEPVMEGRLDEREPQVVNPQDAQHWSSIVQYIDAQGGAIQSKQAYVVTR